MRLKDADGEYAEVDIKRRRGELAEGGLKMQMPKRLRVRLKDVDKVKA